MACQAVDDELGQLVDLPVIHAVVLCRDVHHRTPLQVPVPQHPGLI